MVSKVVTVAFAALFAAVYVAGQNVVQPVAEPLPQQCLGCICEAASLCNVKEGCSGDICGPFHITWAYWADSGKPTLNGQPNTDPSAYANCANDALCAAEIVRGYMRLHGKDCNGDGLVNCDDYVRIHYLGPNSCGTGNPPATYMGNYTLCRDRFL